MNKIDKHIAMFLHVLKYIPKTQAIVDLIVIFCHVHFLHLWITPKVLKIP